MMFSSRALCSLFAVFSTLVTVSNAAANDVWAPAVTYPTFQVVWKIGFQHNVTWDTSSQPANITNPTGLIYLKRNGETVAAGPGSPSQPLASGFNLTDGSVSVTVPQVTIGCGYQLVLMGDSGNVSPQFIIAAEGD